MVRRSTVRVAMALGAVSGLAACSGSGHPKSIPNSAPRSTAVPGTGSVGPTASSTVATSVVTTAPSPTPGALGMAVSSVTFVSADDGWVIGQSGGRTRVEKTTDGGDKWTPLEASPPFTPGSLGPPTGIRFADLMHGYAFSRGVLDVTSDGGESWQQVAVPDEDGAADGTGAADVEVAAGRVWLLNAAAPYPSIYTAPVASAEFSRLGLAGNRGAFLKVHGDEAYVVGLQ